MAGPPYVCRLPDGRYLTVELPEGSAEVDPLTGEMILQAPAIHLLDRLRVVLSPLPPTTTAGRLRTFREALSVSRQEMAARLQVEETQLAEWESGQARPSADQLAALERLRQQAARTGIVLPQPSLAP
jgi:DNA-binding transcriptional regulator YiaG